MITDEPYYRYIPKNGLKMSTKVSMAVSESVLHGEDDTVETIDAFAWKRKEVKSCYNM